MKFEPTDNDKKINPVFIVAYAAFLLIPCFALYKGWQSQNLIAVLAAAVAIAGFSLLIIVSVRHNRKVKQKKRL